MYCEPVYDNVYVGACRSQKRALNSLEMELQAVVCHPTWWKEFWSSRRTIHTINCWTILQSSYHPSIVMSIQLLVCQPACLHVSTCLSSWPCAFPLICFSHLHFRPQSRQHCFLPGLSGLLVLITSSCLLWKQKPTCVKTSQCLKTREVFIGIPCS